jgi:hypothetical protein
MESNFRNDEDRERQNYAVFSDLAYKNQIENDNIPNEFTLDKELSDRQRKTFYNPNTKEIVIAERGTEFKDKKNILKDLASDALLTFGLERYDPRIKQSKRNLDKVKQKYCPDGECNITTTGHSLGAGVSSYLARDPSVKKAVTYNKGFGIGTTRGTGKDINYYTQGDVISNLGALMSRGKNIVTGTKNKNKHSLKNFL